MNQSPELPDNTLLVNAMLAMVNSDSPANRQILYEAMLDSVFIVPTYGDPTKARGLKVYQPGEQIAFVTLVAQDGKQAWAFFTDVEALLAWRSDVTDYYAFQAADIFQMANYYTIDHVLINPAGPVGGQVMNWEIAALAQRSIPDMAHAGLTSENILHDTQVFIGPPAPADEPSAQLANRIAQVLDSHPEIVAGYVFMLAMEDRPPQRVLGVRFAQTLDPQHLELLMTTLAREIASGMDTEEALGLLVLSDDLLPIVTPRVMPLWERA
jgi:hypothetical protein